MSIERDDVAPRRRPRWVRWIAGLGVAGLAAGLGVFAWSRRGDDEAGYEGIPIPAGPQPDLRWTLDALPGGWTAFGAAEVVPQAFSFSWMSMGTFGMAAYGSADDPLAPIVVLGVGDDLNGQGTMSSAAIDMQRFETDTAVGACGTEEFGWRRCLVTAGDRRVQSHSRGLTDDELVRILDAARVVDGAPVAADDSLPQGMVPLGSWRNRVPGVISAVHPDAVASSIAFGGTDGRVSMQVGHADQQDLALGFEMPELLERRVGGVTYYEGAMAELFLRTLAWEQDGLTFELTAIGVEDLDLVALATSVRPPSSQEWEAAVVAPAPVMDRRDQPTTSTTSTESSSTASMPASMAAASLVDVPIAVTVDVPTDGGGLLLRAPVPGVDLALTLLDLPDSMATALGDAPFVVADVEGGVPERLDLVRDDDVVGAYILTTDATAASLRMVRTNGERYVVDLVEVPGDPGRRVAYVAVPAGEFWSVDVIDEFGVVLDLIGKPLD